MYADEVTDSMKQAIGETQRRRKIQIAYNREHDIDPQSIRKKVSDILLTMAVDSRSTVPEEAPAQARAPGDADRRAPASDPAARGGDARGKKDLRFEYAARLRDEVVDLRKELKALRGAGVGG